MWLYGRKIQHLEGRQLVKAILQIINDIHIKRGGEGTEKYIRNIVASGKWGAIQNMNNELNQYLGGIEIPKTIDNLEETLGVNVKVFEALPKTQDKSKSISDLELGRLVAKSAETRLPIQNSLNKRRGYRRLNKQLKSAREKLEGHSC